ncbi:MAG: M48 family metalloprotease [Actinomycetota bacterium]
MKDMERSGSSISLPDWGRQELRVPGRGARAGRIVALFAPVPVLLLLLVPTGWPVLGIALIGGLYAVAVGVWITTQGRRALSSLGARPARSGELARVENLIEGLSSDLGIDAPALFVIDEPGPNALVAKRSGHVIAVTSSLVSEFSRTELEAVLAHCLVRIASRQVAAAQTGLALGRLGRGLGGTTGVADDVATASVTRYPPALASAIERCVPRSGTLAPLWFVAESPSHVAAERRSAALLDL